MKVNQTFVLDANGNVEYPDVFLCSRNHSIIGIINNVTNLKIVVNEKSADEISFDVHKNMDDLKCLVWEDLVDLKCVYVKGFGYFEIAISLLDGVETIKTATGSSQGENELSQINATLEINSENDLVINNGNLTKFYDVTNTDCSLIHRILSYAPHYSVGHVDTTLHNTTKEFSFDTDIMSIFDELSTEVECLFQIDSENRVINVYDLKDTCIDCGSRKVKNDVCTECGSTNIKHGYGNDTQIFISAENLADDITLEGDKDSVKNCLKIKSADELMDAVIAKLNPNGTNKIYKFTDIQLKDMSTELVKKISEYNTNYNNYKEECEELYNNILKCEQTIANYQYNMSPTLELVSGYTCDEMMNAVINKYDGNKIAVLNYSSVSGTKAQDNVKRRIKQMLEPGFELSFGDYTFNNHIYSGSITIKDVVNSTETNIISNTKTITVTIIDADSDNGYKTYIDQDVEDILKKVNIDKIDTIMTYLNEWSISLLSNYSQAIETCITTLLNVGCGAKPTEANIGIQTEKYALYQTWLGYKQQVDNRILELEILVKQETEQKAIYETQMSEIQEALNITSFLGETLWYELCSYIREDTYENNNFSSEFDSDELKPDEMIERAKELYELAEEELDKASKINYSLTASLHNLLVMEEFETLKDKVQMGNYIRAEVDGEIKKLRLISVEFDFENVDMINVTFSDVADIKDETSAVKSILEQSASMATSFNSVKRKSEKGKETYNDFQKIKNEGLSAALFNIKNADEENFVIAEDGVTMKRGNDEAGYDDRQLKIIHNMIAMTDDGWNSVRLAIGQGSYNGQSCYGVWGDVIVGNILASEKLLITNESGTFTVDKDGIIVYNMKLDLYSDDTRLLIDPKLKSLFNIYNLKDNKQTFYIDNNGNLSMLGNLYINNNNIYCKIDMESENIIEIGRGTIIDAGNEGENSKEEIGEGSVIDSTSPNKKKMEWIKDIENLSSISADGSWTSSSTSAKITQGNLTTKNGNTYILQEVNSYSKVIKKFNKDNNNWDVITDLYIFDIDCLKNYDLLLIKDDFEDNCLYIYCYYKGSKTGNHTYMSYIVKYDIDVDMASIYKNIEFSWVKTDDISDYIYNNYSDYNYNPEKAFIKNNILLLEGMTYYIGYFPYRITYNLDTTGDTVSTYKMALHYDYLCDIVDVNGIQYAVTENSNNSFVSLKKIKDFENMIFENINGVSSISTIKCYYGSNSYSYKNGDCVQVCLHDNSIFIFYPKSLYEYVGFEYDLSTNNLKQLIDMPPFYITNNNDLMYIGSICFSDGDYMHFYNTSYFCTYHKYQMYIYGENYTYLLLHYIYKKNNYIKTSGNFKELTDHSKDIEKFGQFGYYYNSGYIYSIDIDGNPIRLNVEKDVDKSWETFTTYKFNNGDYHLIKTNSKDALYAIGDNYSYTSIYRMDLTNGNVDNIYYFNNSGYRVSSTESFYDEINSKLYYCTTRSFNKFAVLDMPIVKDGSGNIIEKTVSTPTELYDNNTWILSNFIFDEDELCYYWVGSYKENNADVYLCKFDFNTHKIENVAIMISVCDYITYAAFTIFRYNNKISLLCAKRGLMNKERHVCDLQTKSVEIKDDVFQDLGGYYKNTYLDVNRTISNVTVGTPYGAYIWNTYPFYDRDNSGTRKCYSAYVYTENETPPEVDDQNKILNDCSWYEIENIANSGKAEKYFNIGDEKTITIDGIDYQVAIADFEHDDLANRYSKAKISFTLKGCLNDMHPVNGIDTNTGGWGSSEIRDYLNVELMKKLPSDLSAIIKPVKKTTVKENGLYGIETTYDKLWLFSEKEIFGYTINSIDGEGEQYTYYNNDDRKNKGNSYWLRTSSQIDNKNFCKVYYSITNSAIETELSNSSSLNGITFGFCIGNGGSSNATTIAPTSDKILYVTNNGSACFYGNVYASNGYFHGDVYAENGYFKGDVYADSGYFKGDIVATSLKLGSDVEIDSKNITGLPESVSDLKGSDVLLKSDDIKIATSKDETTGLTTTTTTFNGTDYTTYTSTDGDYVITNIGLGDKSTEGKSYFVVSKDGLLEANNAIIQGRIIANAGSIGGWNIEYNETCGSYLQSTDNKTSGEMQLLAKNGEIRSRGNYYDTSSDGWYARLYSGKWIFGLYDSTDPWQTGDNRYSDISVNGIFMRSKQCINSGTNQYLLQADTSNDLVSITSSSSNPALSIINNSTGNCLYLENVSCGYENAAFRSKVVCNLMVDGTITESRSGYVTIFGEAAKGRIVFRTDNGTNVSGCDFEDSAIGTVGCRWGEGYFNDLYSVGAVNTSDLKLKDVIGDLDITQSVDFIKSLKPISFTFKDSEHKRIHMGFGAQDIAKSCKDLNMGDMSIYTAIGFDDDGNELYYKEDIPEEKLEWGIKYNELIAPIVKTLQYQQNIIEELQKEINKLKEK